MFAKLSIKKFRGLNDIDIRLGKYVTVIAGKNMTGKSTILGLLGNSSELKSSQGKTYTGKRFRAEFSELFKASSRFDLTGSNLLSVTVENSSRHAVDMRSFRVSWQDEGKRFRLIPLGVTAEGKKTSAKMQFPVMYLGLSRLFPLGEARDESIESRKFKFKNDEDETWFKLNYLKVMGMFTEEITGVSNYSMGEAENKTGFGIETEKYDYLTNSAGQDNLGQILVALLSFKNLHRTDPRLCSSALLLIDELDATLHPYAQNKLLDLFVSVARDTGLQVVFTTHSISIIEHVSKKTARNSIDPDVSNNIELIYLMSDNNTLEVKRNPSHEYIRSGLLLDDGVMRNRKVSVYAEDAEARWVAERLLRIKGYENKVLFRDISIGCDSLLSLFIADRGYFSGCIALLDGDVEDARINRAFEGRGGAVEVRALRQNIIKLPGCERPEKVLLDYLLSIDSSNHPLLRALDEQGVNQGTLRSYEASNLMDGSRESYKQFLKDYQQVFDEVGVIEHWANDNQGSFESFLQEFVRAYNSAADKAMVPKLNADKL